MKDTLGINQIRRRLSDPIHKETKLAAVEARENCRFVLAALDRREAALREIADIRCDWCGGHLSRSVNGPRFAAAKCAHDLARDALGLSGVAL